VNGMDAIQILQAAMALAIATCGFFIKRILRSVDDGQRRIIQIEIELARMKQSEHDLHDRLERMEEKLDQLLSNCQVNCK